MSKSVAVRTADVKALLGIAAGLAERGHLSSTNRQEYALDCLRGHLRARAGIFGLFHARPPSTRPMYPVHLAMVGFTDGQLEVWRKVLRNFDQYVNNPIADCVARGLGGARRRGVRSISRGDALSPREWYRHAYVQEVLKRVNVDPFVAIFEPVGEAGYAFLSLRRDWRDRPFSKRARRILELFGSSTGRLLWSRDDLPKSFATPNDPLSGLSARRSEVLQHLLDGASEKEIAIQLCRSPHTVHRHVTDLYRHFGVSTRAELLARFIEQRPPRRTEIVRRS